MITYHEIRGISPQKARQLVRRVLLAQRGNVSTTAAILGISRHTVRRAREGPLEDHSRRPKHCPRKTPERFECWIVCEAQRTGFRYRRLGAYLFRKYGLRFSENTIKAILRRNQIKRPSRRTSKGKSRPLYDYEALMPFSEMQLDTKHLLDKKALPKDVYEHMVRCDLPLYEWHMMDVATRARFTAYSHELSATFGFLFIVLVLLWLRAHGVKGQITIRVDNGSEFCGGSARKLSRWNEQLKPLGAVLVPIPARAKHLMALVENAHRADDEYFLMIHAERCPNSEVFLKKAQSWQDTWNFYRPSFGIAMGGLTPHEKLKSKKTMVHSHVLLFPVVRMESLLKYLNTIKALFIVGPTTGKYVYAKCLSRASFPQSPLGLRLNITKKSLVQPVQ